MAGRSNVAKLRALLLCVGLLASMSLAYGTGVGVGSSLTGLEAGQEPVDTRARAAVDQFLAEGATVEVHTWEDAEQADNWLGMHEAALSDSDASEIEHLALLAATSREMEGSGEGEAIEEAGDDLLEAVDHPPVEEEEGGDADEQHTEDAHEAVHRSLAEQGTADADRLSAQFFFSEAEVPAEPSDSSLEATGTMSAIYPATMPVWRGRWDSRNRMSYFAPYMVENRMPDSRTFRKLQTGQEVLQVTFQAGAWSPNAAVQGGSLFHVFPFGWGAPIAQLGATLEYEVYFPSDFDWVKGGKLPGLAGGPTGCGGGKDPVSCWSARIMWRREGDGEAYMYVPEGHQGGDFCNNVASTRTICDYHAGVSFRRGAWRFQKNKWHKIRLSVILNTAGQANGLIQISVDGNVVISYDRIAYRLTADLAVDTVYFSTWFGGADASWAPSKTTYALFRNMRIYTYDDPGQARVPPNAMAQSASQTVVTTRIDEPEF